MSDASGKTLLFISMLGENELFNPNHYQSLCSSGLEKDWIVDWFDSMASDAGFSLSAIDICRGDELPLVEQIDCVIVGGTIHTVNENRPWLKLLNAWLPHYRRSGKPLLGICGGHQLISTQLEDGKLKERNDGIFAGTHTIELTTLGRAHPLFDGLANPRFSFGNFYHVIPSETQQGNSLAHVGDSSAICIDHGGQWYSAQFHPESRKPVWSCMFEHTDPAQFEKYSDDQDGAIFMKNFLNIAANG